MVCKEFSDHLEKAEFTELAAAWYMDDFVKFV